MSASGSFTAKKETELVCGEVKQGTTISCYLRKDQCEFLEERRLTDVVKKHPELIGFLSELHAANSNEKGWLTNSEEFEEEKKVEKSKDGEKPKCCF